MRRTSRGFAWLVGVLSVASLGAEPLSKVPVVDAVKAGDTKALNALLQQGLDVNIPAVDGTTALHWAAYREEIATVDRLLKAGANVKASNRYGATPLSVASENGNAAVIDRLLKAGAGVNGVTAGGETALMTVARTGKVDAVKILIAHGADVNARESTRGQTALMWAAGEGHADVIRELVTAGADIHAVSRPPAAAAMTNAYGTMRRSTKRIDAFTPYLFAVRSGRLEAASTLIELGADVNEMLPDGTSALVMAAANAHWEMAALLLDKGANPNAAKQGWTALNQLARTRSLNIGFFPHPEPTGKISSLTLAERLLDKGADINAPITKPIADGYRGQWTQIGATPLAQAAKGADAALMRLLISKGADVSLTNAKGTDILMLASGVEMFNPNEDGGTNEEALECVKIALEARREVNATNKDGDTPMHGAAWRGANDIVQLLADRGAKLDAKNKQGFTPLMVANGEEEGRVSNISVRPWTVTLLQKLLTERGLPAELGRGVERYRFEKVAPSTAPRGRGRQQPQEAPAESPSEAPSEEAPAPR